MNIKKLVIIGLLIFSAQVIFAQSYFDTQEEIVDYFKGTWNLDMVSWMGHIDTLPDPGFFDNSTHKIEFKKFNDDMFPLLCRAYIDDELFEETFVEIEFNDMDGFPGPWRLKNVPSNLAGYVAIDEGASWLYGISADSVTLFQMAFDGFSFAMSREIINSFSQPDLADQINIYPNPIIDNTLCVNISKDISLRQIRIFDSNGKPVLHQQLNESSPCIEIGLIQAGMYLVELIDKNEIRYNYKIVKPRL